MSEPAPRPSFFATLSIELLKLAPILAAIWISIEANQLSRSQLTSSEESLQRTYAPLLIPEQPLFQEVLEGGKISHVEFFARVVNLSPNPAHNLTGQVFVGDSPMLETPVSAPVLAGLQTQLPQDIRLRRDFAITAPVPTDKATAIFDGEPLLKLVLEHEDLFGNRLRTSTRYEMKKSGRSSSLHLIETKTERIEASSSD
tara:strand:- start:9354 stop:9953 length:600 start_codon:yes stop_codon:yes gene_type:complete